MVPGRQPLFVEISSAAAVGDFRFINGASGSGFEVPFGAGLWMIQSLRYVSIGTRPLNPASPFSAPAPRIKFIDSVLPCDDLVGEPHPSVRRDVSRTREAACLFHSVKR